MIVYSDTRQVKSFSPIMTSSYFLITSSMYLSASLVLSFHRTVADVKAGGGHNKKISSKSHGHNA